MVTAGQVMENPVTGARIRWLKTAADTDGKQLQFEWVWRPHAGKVKIAHFHPRSDEQADILSGVGRYRLGKQEFAVKAGDTVKLPAGIVHVHPWNVGDEELRYIYTTWYPDGGAERGQDLVQSLFALSQVGKVTRDGVASNPLQFAVLSDAVRGLVYVEGVPVFLQDPLLAALGALGRALGYRADIPYRDHITPAVN